MSHCGGGRHPASGFRACLFLALVVGGLSACRRDPLATTTAPATERTYDPVGLADRPTELPEGGGSAAAPEATPDVLATVQAEVLATLVALASASPTATSTPAAVVGVAALPAGSPEPGCELPSEPLGLSLRIDPAAPQPTVPSAPYFDSYRVQVTEHREAERVFALRSEDPPLPFGLELGYAGEPPPLDLGAVYTITHYDDLHLPSPAGEGLRIDDERGLLVLGVNLREGQGAATRVLGGERAGWTVETLAATCRFTLLDACGYERRAAPVRFRRPEGAEAVLQAPGEQILASAGAPSYRVILATSHLRLWRGDLPCADPTDWVQSFRITRQSQD